MKRPSQHGPSLSNQPSKKVLKLLLLGCPRDIHVIRVLTERLNRETDLIAEQFFAPSEEQWKPEVNHLVTDVDATLVCLPNAVPPPPWGPDRGRFPNHPSDLLDALEKVDGHGGFVVPVKLGASHLPWYHHWSTPVVNLYEMRGYGALLRLLSHRKAKLGFPRGNFESSRYGVRAFISYCHRDEALRNRLEKHLSILKRQGHIDAWHDRLLEAGADFDDEIIAQLESAELIMLLVSADFLASDYCWGREMIRAMQRHEAGQTVVVPIIARPCDWHPAPFAHLLALPQDGKAISSKSWPTIDTALTQVAKGIRSIVESIRGVRFDEDLLSMPGVNTNSDISTSRLYPLIFEPSHIEFKRDFYRSDYIDVDIYGGSEKSQEIFEASGYTNMGGPSSGEDWLSDHFSIASPLPITSENTFVCEHYRIVDFVKQALSSSHQYRVESFFHKAYECIPTYYRASEPIF